MSEQSMNPVSSRPPLSGLAVTAFVLGIIGILLAFIPLVNVISFLLATIALVMGIIGIVLANGIKRRGRGLAIAGVVLAVLTFFIAWAANAVLFAVGDAVSESLTVTVDTSAAGGAEGTAADPLPFGSEVSLSNGLTVNVGVPQEVPDETSFNWSVEVSITNTSDSSSTPVVTSTGSLVSGEVCDRLYSGDDLGTLDTIPPGKTVSGNLSFSCANRGDVELQFSPSFTSPNIYYAGPTS